MNRKEFLKTLGLALPLVVIGKVIKPTKKFPPSPPCIGGPKPQSLYIGLCSNGKEVSGNGYARQRIPKPDWATKQWSNVEPVTFGTATDKWGVVDEMAIWTSPTGGEVVYNGKLWHPKLVQGNEIPQFEAGSIELIFS